MKLPYQMIRTADHDRLQEENRFLHRLIDSDTNLIHLQLDCILCLEDELEQYQQALEEMTRSRNLSRAGMHYWHNAVEEVLEASAPARTTEPEPQPAELAEPLQLRRCSTCDFVDVGVDYEPCYSCHSWCNWKPAGGAAE